MAKGNEQHIPSQTVFHNVCSGTCCSFLHFYNLDSKGSHKATTHDCVPHRRDCGVCSEHTVLFLCLCNLASKSRHKAVTLTAFLGY